MIQLTEEMKRLINNAREDGFPCIVATSSPDGTPNAGYIGTVLAVDDSTLVYRDRTRRMPLEHLEENPKVIVLFRNAASDAGWKFRCTATDYGEGPYFDEVNRRLSPTGGDAAHTGTVVVLDIDQVLTLFGEVLQEKEPGRRW